MPLDCAADFKSEGLGITLLERFMSVDPNALIGLPLLRLTRIPERLGLKVELESDTDKDTIFSYVGDCDKWFCSFRSWWLRSLGWNTFSGLWLKKWGGPLTLPYLYAFRRSEGLSEGRFFRGRVKIHAAPAGVSP
jgi:hypothetical protein